MTDNDRARSEGLLSRWSQRKRAVRESEAAEAKAEQDAAQAAQQAEDEETLAANRAAAEAIDLDSLTADTDMSPFFKAGVPAALKSAALRKLWRSHPVFACLDGLNDYDENFADPKLIMKVAKSSWEVGSGYAKRLLELDEKAKEIAAQAEGRTVEGAPAATSSEAAVEAAPGEAAEAEPAAEPAEPAETVNAGEEVAETEEPAEEAEPAPRVPLRTRLDFAAFRDEG